MNRSKLARLGLGNSADELTHPTAFVEPITTQVADDEGMITAVVNWRLGNEKKSVESYFRLQLSPYFGWDVVQTSLLEDLLAVLIVGQHS